MWRPSNVIPFWIVVGFVFAVVWPPGAIICLAAVAYTVYRWVSDAQGKDKSGPDDASR